MIRYSSGDQVIRSASTSHSQDPMCASSCASASACSLSASLARAPSERSHSVRIAATSSAVTAATATKSWACSNSIALELPTNGPSPWAVK